jgi:hypothetical protein
LTIRAVRFVATTIAIALLWNVAMAAVFRVTERAPGALVLFPDRHLAAGQLPAGVTILKWNSWVMSPTSTPQGFPSSFQREAAAVSVPDDRDSCVFGEEKPDWQGTVRFSV